MVDFDGDSVVAGASRNRLFWANRSPVPIATTISRQYGHLATSALALTAQRLLHLGAIPVLLGGGHSLTYWMLLEAIRFYGKLNVLHFDAHHDAYRDANITHYSFMHRLSASHEFGYRAVGTRYELDAAQINEHPPIPGAPWYVTLDVDYFDTTLVKSVIAPVPLEAGRADLNTFTKELDLLTAPIIGFDVVEWISQRATSVECDLVLTALSALKQRAESSCV
ncbi:arginase family protein [Curtobacterium luteum]|uniref:arginase family protein n=1 Tax=Curtobacterium luteum TaxID=33881 RepID=UPI0038052F35